jgi:hypothetical protein
MELPLGERPVVIGRPVDQDDLDRAVLAVAPDDAAAGPDDWLARQLDLAFGLGVGTGRRDDNAVVAPTGFEPALPP